MSFASVAIILESEAIGISKTEKKRRKEKEKERRKLQETGRSDEK